MWIQLLEDWLLHFPAMRDELLKFEKFDLQQVASVELLEDVFIAQAMSAWLFERL
jgi:hypothetical protein